MQMGLKHAGYGPTWKIDVEISAVAKITFRGRMRENNTGYLPLLWMYACLLLLVVLFDLDGANASQDR